MRRTKIVCTIGPASSSTAELDRLVAAGLGVPPPNFLPGTRGGAREVGRRVREREAGWGPPVAIPPDLQGPEIRLGTFGPAGGGRVDLEAGQPFTLFARPVVGTVERASITHPEDLKDLQPDDEIWMDDGMIQLRVEATSPDEVRCRVVVGGRVSDHKGLSLPHVTLPISCLTPKDREDLHFGLRHGVDFVAVSFVRSADNIEEVQNFLREQNADLPIIAKLERHEILANLPGILSKVDAVIVARGDLGVDVPLEDVPHIQKEIIRQARGAKVPVIVATQRPESRVTHLRPTRAEVSNVSTAIYDGADAVMLSAETATGRYPHEAVAVMARVAERADGAVLSLDRERRRRPGANFQEAISDAAASAAHVLSARAIVAFTESGFSARLISQARPSVPIIALTPFVEVQRRLALSWGVTSRLIRKVETTDEMIEEVEANLLGDGVVRPNDVIVIISGSPMWVRGTTNLPKLHRVGERRT